MATGVVASRRAGAKNRKVTCGDCFFAVHELCALGLDAPCTTFRPNHPDGLRPPQQMRFVFRQERREKATWAFPSAEERRRYTRRRLLRARPRNCAPGVR